MKLTESQQAQAAAYRGYSLDIADHHGLITKLAQRGLWRLQRAGVVTDFEDVFQDMSVSYVKAKLGFDALMGFTFTAYLGRAIWQDFNRVAERLINDQIGLGLVRMEDMGGDEIDAYELVASPASTPEEQYLGGRAFGDGMRALTIKERTVVGKFIRQEMPGVKAKSESLSKIMRDMKMHHAEMVKSRKNICQAFDVNLKGTKWED